MRLPATDKADPPNRELFTLNEEARVEEPITVRLLIKLALPITVILSPKLASEATERLLPSQTKLRTLSVLWQKVSATTEKLDASIAAPSATAIPPIERSDPITA
jgi:hypothetical protein